mmetsp:Transcript_75550/g.244565  ORF Transcript_75550/g.244565 Transcript_75550/m.244565 type:complete len:201 (-) Transcript_75550:15-617(-)
MDVSPLHVAGGQISFDSTPGLSVALWPKAQFSGGSVPGRPVGELVASPLLMRVAADSTSCGPYAAVLVAGSPNSAASGPQRQSHFPGLSPNSSAVGMQNHVCFAGISPGSSSEGLQGQVHFADISLESAAIASQGKVQATGSANSADASSADAFDTEAPSNDHHRGVHALELSRALLPGASRTSSMSTGLLTIDSPWTAH